MRPNLRLLTILAITGGLTGSVVRAQCELHQVAKLIASDAAATDWFGRSVSISGDTAIVGANLHDGACPANPNCDSGSAYVFLRTGGVWSLQQELTASDTAAGDSFGASVTIEGETVVVGAPFADAGAAGAGAAYVFVRSGSVWIQKQKLTPLVIVTDAEFGSSVSLSGQTVAVGAPPFYAGTNSPGSAYVFRHHPELPSGNQWLQEQKLTPTDSSPVDQFGFAVAVSGETVVVGAQGTDGACPLNPDCNSGSAYVFVKPNGGWPSVPSPMNETARLTASDAATEDTFGHSVSVSGDTVMVGADRNDDAGYNSGSAYVFVMPIGGWSTAPVPMNETQKLVASDAAAGDAFGQAVFMDGVTAVIGAYQPGYSVPPGPGKAYVFVRNGGGWTQTQKLTASDAAAADQFGLSVSLSGGTVLLGANFDDDSGAESGSAYVIDLGCHDADGDGYGSPGNCACASGGALDCNDADPAVHPGATESCNGIDDGCSGTVDDGDPGSGGACSTGQQGVCSNGTTHCVGGALVCVRNVGAGAEGCNGSDDNCNGQVDEAAEQQLVAADAAAADYFGFFVSVSGGTAVVGALLDDHDGVIDAGSVYVYARDSTGPWTQTQKLIAVDAALDDRFGSAVSVDADTIVVGAPFDDSPGQDAGSVYVYVRTGGVWAVQQKLTASDAQPDDRFGSGVSVSGDTVVVGAPNLGDSTGAVSGAAYVFVRSQGVWIQQQKLMAADPAGGDSFGLSVSVSGDTAVVGSHLDDDACPANPDCDSGSAYVFLRSGGVWTQRQKLTASDQAERDFFGEPVSVSGNTVIVGASKKALPGPGSDAGATYVFVLNGTVWTQQQRLTASDAAAGDRFGFGVSVSGDRAVVGTFFADAAVPDTGSAYLFVRTGNLWAERTKLTASGAMSGDLFGYDVSIDGDSVLVGAVFDDDACPGNPNCDSGSAYVFDLSCTGSCIGAPDGTNCDDGNACTSGDTCGGALCSGTSITAPPETQNMAVASDKATYSWSAATYATRYDVVRGSTAAFPIGPGGGDEVCFEDLAGASLSDPAVPALGAGFWYLSRGENACGIGTLGSQSDGSSRITATCP